ncbi:MAG TPA: alpha/beta hydrolase [Gemmatimonadales bacterium]|nr:alpha/beta hydrolase [Gemmatimonadales bacterium]
MLALRIAVGLGLSYAILALLAWKFQERLAFPAPRAPVPDPQRVGVTNGQVVELVSADGTRLVGWYLAPKLAGVGEARGGRGRLGEASPALLWFYGNGENVAAIWPIVREFQPPGMAVLVVDYPGYGGSGGKATEAGLYAAADAAYALLAARPDIDPHRIYVYGRSLGSVAATYTATQHSVAGLILESPFTNARGMARHLYALLPRFTLTLRLDNLANVKRIHCPILVFHGDADRLVPTAMGLAVAAAAPQPAEVVLIHGAGHNDTYDVGGPTYRRKLWEFVAQR